MKHFFLSLILRYFLLTFAGRVNNEPSVVTVNTTQSSLSHGAVNNEIRKGDGTDVVVPSSSSQMSTSSTTLDGQEKKTVNSSGNKAQNSKPLVPSATVPVTTGNSTSNVLGDSRNIVGNARYNSNKNNNNNTTNSISTVNNPLVTTQPKINNNSINNNSNGNSNNSHRINEENAGSEVRITNNDQQVSCILNIQTFSSFDFQNFSIFLLALKSMESVILKLVFSILQCSFHLMMMKMFCKSAFRNCLKPQSV